MQSVHAFSKKEILKLTILFFEKVVQFTDWLITSDLLGQLWRNVGFTILQFDCVSEFESSQAFSECGEDTVARDFFKFRVEKKLNKASCQAATMTLIMRRNLVESNDRHTGQKTSTPCVPTIADLRCHRMRERGTGEYRPLEKDRPS